MVAAVVGGEQLVGVLGIADDGVKIDDCIKVAVGADPLIDGLAVGFTEWSGMIVAGADIRCDGGAIDPQAVGMGARDDLLISGKDALDEGGMRFGGDFWVNGQAAEIVDALKDDDPSDAGGCEDVAIEASEG